MYVRLEGGRGRGRGRKGERERGGREGEREKRDYYHTLYLQKRAMSAEATIVKLKQEISTLRVRPLPCISVCTIMYIISVSSVSTVKFLDE